MVKGVRNLSTENPRWWTHGSAQHSKVLCDHSAVGGTAFGPLKEQLGGRKFHINEEVETAIRDWLRMEDADFWITEIF